MRTLIHTETLTAAPLGGENILIGTGGDDTLTGGDGSNVLIGMDGNDTLTGGMGIDILIPGVGVAAAYTGGAYGFIVGTSAAPTHVTIDGGAGTFDYAGIDWFSETQAIVIDISNPAVVAPITLGGTTIGSITGVEELLALGGFGDDHLTGGALADSLTGEEGNDTLIGNDGADTLTGGPGDDILNGGPGNDSLIGGPGIDTAVFSGMISSYTIVNNSSSVTVTGPDGTDTLQGIEQLQFSNGLLVLGDVTNGTSGADTLSTTNTARNQIVYGLDGDDSLTANANTGHPITLIGGTGNDTLTANTTLVELVGGDGNDIITDNGGSNQIDGGAGDDIISAKSGSVAYGGDGNDHMTGINAELIGDAGDDVITDTGGLVYGGTGTNTLTGLGGATVLSYQDSQVGVTVSLALTTAQNTGHSTDTLSGFTNLNGSAHDDVLSGDANANTLFGDLGNDTLLGMGGNDTLNGSYGNDYMDGGTGNNTVTYAGLQDLQADGTYAGVSVDLTITGPQVVGAAGGADTLVNIQNLTGTSYNDTLKGGAGGSILSGSDGNDTLIGGPGNDTLNGGNGIDTVSYANATAGVIINLATTTAQNTEGAGTDILSSIENVIGSAFNDGIVGTTGDNVLNGGAGDDLLLNTPNGSVAGNDTLLGGDGNDRIELLSGSGTATVDGGAGFDTLDLSIDTGPPSATINMQTGQATLGGLSITFQNIEAVIGTAYVGSGDTMIESSSGNNSLDGGAGVDTVDFSYAAAGVTVSLALTGAQNTIGAGTDTLANFENLTGSAFNDVLTGSSANNVLDGWVGTNTVSYADAAAGVTVSLALGGAQNTVGDGTDTLKNFQNLTGSAFNDTLSGNAGANVLDGGVGTNTVSYAYATSGVAVSLALTGAQNTVGAGTDTLLNFQNLQGSAFDDTLAGNAGDNVLDGWVGTNTVSYAYATSGVAVSLALTGAQNTVGAGTDTLENFQNLQGSAFDDTLYGNAGANVLDGWVGTNTVSYAYATSGVTVSLALTGAQNTVGAGTDTLENFQNLQGSAFDDTLYGNAGANVLDGWVGTNTVSYAYATSGVAVSLALTGAQNTVGAGTDTLENFQNLQGSAFDDTLYGNSGNNVLDGWVGTNTVSYAYATSGVTVSLALTGAQNTVGAGTDTLENFQNLQGSAFDDTLAGNAGDNVLDGWVGTNTVSYEHAAAGVTVSLAVSGAQNTIGDGTDTLENFQNLIGSAFNDILTGNTANNVLTGNGGADTFQFNTSFGQDTITDFIPGDIIHFGAGTFADFATVSSHAVQQGSDVLITLDANDTLLLKNVQLANLHAGDFVFG